MLVVELPLVERNDHLRRVEQLPSSIEGCHLILRYNNGPLPNSQRMRPRGINPKPKTLVTEVLNSFAAVGKEVVVRFGKRFTIDWKEGTQGKGIPDEVQYISIEQDAFATNAPLKTSGVVDDHIIYADSFDPSIKAGFRIVQKAKDEDNDEDKEAINKEPPQKKQKNRLVLRVRNASHES